MKHLGVHNIRHSKIVLADNERTKWGSQGLEQLCKSIAATGGNITPAVVELVGYHRNPGRSTAARLNSKKNSEKPFESIAGHRRYEATRITGTQFRANVYYDLTEVERAEIQMIENSTKAKIPHHELGQNLCEMYKLLVAGSLGKRDYREFAKFIKTRDYETLRPIIPYTEFHKITNAGKKAFRTARYYDNAGKEAKRLVEAKKLSYGAAAEVGRVPKELQSRVIDRINSLAKHLNPGMLSIKYVRKIAHGFVAAQQKQPLTLIQETEQAPNKEINLKPLAVAVSKINCLKQAGIDTQRIESIVWQQFNRIAELQKHYATELKMAGEEYERRNKPLLERIASSEFNRRQLVRLDMSKARYKELPSDKIHPCRQQARKTLENIHELAATIRKYGILQPILVRPKDGKYEIVAGERRYRGARKARLATIPTICCPMDDITAHIVRREEDLFETVDPRDRAESLCRLYLQAGISETEFAKKYLVLKSQKSRDVREALRYGQLDPTTKLILAAGNRPYSTGVAISAAEKTQQYAMMAAILNMPTQKLRKTIAEEKQQPTLFDHSRKDGLERRLEKDIVEKMQTLENPTMLQLNFGQMIQLHRIIRSVNELCLYNNPHKTYQQSA